MKHNLYKMRCLDIFLSGLSQEEYNKIKHQIDSSKLRRGPLLSWDIFMENYHKRITEAKKNVEIQKVNYLAKKFRWSNDLNIVFKENDYDAIVITDLSQRIIWINDGFTKMTGYSKKFAMNKTPGFLHGEKTSIESKKRFKEKIIQDRPFQDRIVNYKKSKTPYNSKFNI